MSSLTATLMIIASCIGTGIFTTTGFLINELQSPLLVFGVWCLAGIYALVGVRCYQELHSYYPSSGGEYHFLTKGWHPMLGKFAGAVSLVAGFSAPIAASAMGFALYAHRFYAYSMSPSTLATLLLVVVTVLQMVSSHRYFRMHNLFVVGKLIGLGLLILICSVVSQWNPWESSIQSLANSDPLYRMTETSMASAVAHAFFWCAYAFSGWNAVFYIASEVTKNKSDVRRASVWGTVGVCALYLSLNAVLLFSGDVAALQGEPEVVGVFLSHTFGVESARWLSFLIAFGLISTTSALFITGPRVYARMAEDGALPKLFYTHPGQLPRASLLLQMAIALLILWTLDFDKILHTTGFVLTLCSALAVSVLFKKISPRRPLFYLALLFCVATLWLAYAGMPRSH